MRATICLLTWFLIGTSAASLAAVPFTEATPPAQLKSLLRFYPEADTNKDGTLTYQEAEAYRLKLGGTPADIRQEYTFATASDGVKIAIGVAYPRGFDASDTSRKWPTIFMTCGYTGCTEPPNPLAYGNNYVTVSASLRGTGASGGVISPWRKRTWQDGYDVIEGWIVKQPWSNGRVGMIGRSWPGLMGFLTATTAPPSLKAVVVSGLIDDYYRGFAYPGGIRNVGFSYGWTSFYYHPGGPFGSGHAARENRGMSDDEYQAVVDSRPQRDLKEDFLWMILHDDLDSPKWQQQALSNQAPGIRAALLMGHSWQDEQTGPTGWQAFNNVPDDVPKRLILSNGSHNSNEIQPDEQMHWFDHWLRDEPNEEIRDPARRVKIFFETFGENPGDVGTFGKPLVSPQFPLPQTRWTRYYLRPGLKLSSEAPKAGERPDQYGTHDANRKKQQLVYQMSFSEATALCGPAVLTVWATLNTLDTDFYAMIADVGPDGTAYGLQRGLLRASHRKLDPRRCEFANVGGRKVLIRPYHFHTALEPVTPDEPNEYQIEIPAFGHVFRPGHKLALFISRPPETDPVIHGHYRYDSDPPPSMVTVHHDAKHPSSLLLPVLPELPPLGEKAVPLDQQAGIWPVPLVREEEDQ
jgi:predicted acyl esterase